MNKQISNLNRFNIFVDQLKNGHVEKIEEKFSPDFLDINEKELFFKDPVFVRGKAYIAEANLVLHLEVITSAYMPCSICNEEVKVLIKLPYFYHSEPLENIKSGVFSMVETLRETILIETPSFAECNEGNCVVRKEQEKFYKKSSFSEGDDHYHPFENLKF